MGTLPENIADNVVAMCETYPELSDHSLPEICDTLPNHPLCREVSGPKKKKQCKAKPAASCVFQRKGKRCLPTPLNGGTCSTFGKKKLSERVSGCLWSGSRKTGSCGQP